MHEVLQEFLEGCLSGCRGLKDVFMIHGRLDLESSGLNEAGCTIVLWKAALQDYEAMRL